jgi:spore coat protein CotH
LNIPTPRLSYVNLYINGALHGLYTLVEQVDSEFLEENFENPEGIFTSRTERAVTCYGGGQILPHIPGGTENQ